MLQNGNIVGKGNRVGIKPVSIVCSGGCCGQYSLKKVVAETVESRRSMIRIEGGRNASCSVGNSDQSVGDIVVIRVRQVTIWTKWPGIGTTTGSQASRKPA